MPEQLDCLVIGGGPAGLMAGVYLARFRRSVALLDHGDSRALLIPHSRNAPAYPKGISGRMLLARLRRQAAQQGAEVIAARATHVTGGDGDFRVETEAGTLRARKIILATGIKDILPARHGEFLQYIRKGRVRVCPVCDAYELRGRPILVLGRGERGASEALYLRHYTSEVTLLTDAALPQSLTPSWRARL